MQALIFITQLPDYRAQLLCQLKVLEIADGFTQQDKADLMQIYTDLLNKIDTILAADTEVNQPLEVNFVTGEDNRIIRDVRDIEVQTEAL